LVARANARDEKAGRNGGLKSTAATSRIGRHVGRDANVELCARRDGYTMLAKKEIHERLLCAFNNIEREREREREPKKSKEVIAKADKRSALDVSYFEGANK